MERATLYSVVTEKGFVKIKLYGNNLYRVGKKYIPIAMAKGILLLLSVLSSDILMLINININKNKIDTAPTYTNKYDKPIKFIPNVIR